MYIQAIQPPKFNSNIYVFRAHLSNWLSKHVDIRNNIGTFIVSPDAIIELDVLLKQTHHRFIEIKNTIDLLENDCANYGSPLVSDQETIDHLNALKHSLTKNFG